ncbi:hypothetical protein HY772_09685, partial [Candidatus Woesearchaeota archaeon]|nr:hypothetical protein [Candidatus Woesearchaeota archaeon]
MKRTCIYNVIFFLLIISLGGCYPNDIHSTSTLLPPTIFPSSSPTLTTVPIPINQVAYGQWDVHYMHYDILWLANSDGSDRRVAFDWLGFTEDFSFMPDGSGMFVWTNEAPGGYSKRYIQANLVTNLPGPCVTCFIEGVTGYPPIPSPQGEKAAIKSRSGLYISNVDGTGAQLIIPEDERILYVSWPPSWSPDGQYISVDLLIEGSGLHIFSIRSDGIDLVNLTKAQNSNGDFASSQ